MTTVPPAPADTRREEGPHLDGEEVIQIKRLIDRKSRIDQQVAFLTSLPRVAPFDPVAPARSPVSRKEWEQWWRDHDRIEQEAGIFRADELTLLKKVARSKTTNMSHEDTDLVELTLTTLEAFSRLEHLLRSRRKHLQVLDLRLRWDQQIEAAWLEHRGLQSDIPALLTKIRWQPSTSESVGPSSPRLRAASGSYVPGDYGTPLAPRPRKESSSLRPGSSRSTSAPRFASEPEPPSQPPSPVSLPATTTPLKPPGLRAGGRKVSLFGPPASVPGSPYSKSAQSRLMRAQSHALQLSTVNSRIHAMNRLVAPTATTMDKMIDGGLHIPDAFLDEQDGLEGVVERADYNSVGRFLAEVVDQWKCSDEVWWGQRDLEGDAGMLVGEVESALAKLPDEAKAAGFEEQLKTLQARLQALAADFGAGQITRGAAGKVGFPTHTLHSDQHIANQSILTRLCAGYSDAEGRVKEAAALVRSYRFAAVAVATAKRLREEMDGCSARLARLTSELESLPGRPDLGSIDCLVSHPQEVQYETRRTSIADGIAREARLAKTFFDSTTQALADLTQSGVDSNFRREVRDTMAGMKDRHEAAERLTAARQSDRAILDVARSAWAQLTNTGEKVDRAHRELWSEVEKWRWKPGMDPGEAVRLSPPCLLAEQLRECHDRQVRPAVEGALVRLRPHSAPLCDHIGQELAKNDALIAGLARLHGLREAACRQRIAVGEATGDAALLTDQITALHRRAFVLIDATAPPLPEPLEKEESELREAAAGIRPRVDALFGSLGVRVPMIAGGSLPVAAEPCQTLDLSLHDDAVRGHVNEMALSLSGSLDDLERTLQALPQAFLGAGVDRLLAAVRSDLEALQTERHVWESDLTGLAKKADQAPFVSDAEISALSSMLALLQDRQRAVAADLLTCRTSLRGMESLHSLIESERAGKLLSPRQDTLRSLENTHTESAACLTACENQADALGQKTSAAIAAHTVRQDILARNLQTSAAGDAVEADLNLLQQQVESLGTALKAWAGHFESRRTHDLDELPDQLEDYEGQLELLRTRHSEASRDSESVDSRLDSISAEIAATCERAQALAGEVNEMMQPTTSRLTEMQLLRDIVTRQTSSLQRRLECSGRSARQRAEEHSRRLALRTRARAQEEHIRQLLSRLQSLYSAISRLEGSLAATLGSSSAVFASWPGSLRSVVGELAQVIQGLEAVKALAAGIRSATLHIEDELDSIDSEGPDLAGATAAAGSTVTSSARLLLLTLSERQTATDEKLAQVLAGTQEHIWSLDPSMQEAEGRHIAEQQLGDALARYLGHLERCLDEAAEIADQVASTRNEAEKLARRLTHRREETDGPQPLLVELHKLLEDVHALSAAVDTLSKTHKDVSAVALCPYIPSACNAIQQRLASACASNEPPISGLEECMKRLLADLHASVEEAETAQAELDTASQVMETINDIHIEEWVSSGATTQATLPNEDVVSNFQAIISEAQAILDDISLRASATKTRLEEGHHALAGKRLGLERCRKLAAFLKQADAVDSALSSLLDQVDILLDVSPRVHSSASVRDALAVASSSMTTLRALADPVADDSRVAFTLSRLDQTWDELSAMAQDTLNGTNPTSPALASTPLNRSKLSSSQSTTPLFNQSNRARALSQVSTGSASRIPRLGPSRSTQSPPVSSPSLGIGRPPSRASMHPGLTVPGGSATRPQSRLSSAGHSRPPLSRSWNASSKQTRSPAPLLSAFGTSITPTAPRTSQYRPNAYKPHVNRRIDRLVSNVVNELPVRVDVSVVVSSQYEDNSGTYWIGEKQYFCRILRSQTVMVRIGGGWIELSRFLLDHYKQEFAVSPPRNTDAGQPAPPPSSEEKWISAETLRRASLDHQMVTPTLKRSRKISLASTGGIRASGAGLLGTPSPAPAAPAIVATPPEAIQLFMRKTDTPTPAVRKKMPWRP